MESHPRAERAERRLAAILAADVAGYSRLMEADEEGTLAALRAVRREVGDPAIAAHNGRVVKTTGDADAQPHDAPTGEGRRLSLLIDHTGEGRCLSMAWVLACAGMLLFGAAPGWIAIRMSGSGTNLSNAGCRAQSN